MRPAYSSVHVCCSVLSFGIKGAPTGRLRARVGWLIIHLMARNRGQIDTTIEIVTPENIAFRYRIRMAIGGVGMLGLAMAFGLLSLPGIGIGLGMVLWFVLAWFYGGMFEAYWNGQTPGKRLMQIRVLTVDGRPINGLQAVLRNVLRVLDAAPPLIVMGQPNAFLGTYLLGLVAATTNDRFQRLGDLVCGTMVVREERGVWAPALARTDAPQVRRLESLIPPSFQPSRSLSRALAIYVQRRRQFSLARRLEMARHLGEPLRRRFGLPADTSHDMLLCTLYERSFVDRSAQQRTPAGSPFAQPQPAPEVPAVVEAVVPGPTPVGPRTPDEREEP